MRLPLSIVTILSVLLPSVAIAHTGGSDLPGFGRGFLHPLTGLDHTLAMFTIGLIACRLGGRALWLVPLIFVICTAFGGILTVSGTQLFAVEPVIALSVVGLGLMVALKIKPPLLVTLAVAGLFAIFHGHAHMTEMPATASGFAYGIGFLIATAGLHSAGIGVGLAADRVMRAGAPILIRSIAGAISVAGLALLAVATY